MSDNPQPEHAAPGKLEILAVPGLPRFGPGDSLVEALVEAAPWLADNDIVVITSKIVSKTEGRMVTAPSDPEQRDALRRKLIADESVRVLATKGKTWITENAYGLVQAAAGVDGSNVDPTELALLPVDPDRSAAEIRAHLAQQLGVRVAVVITDTMGRAWRTGQTDVAIGSAGIPVTVNYEGAHDVHGNELQVTDIAVADEIAAAADLVKGKLGQLPVAVVRGLRLPESSSTARDLVRPGEEDLFWLGTAEALAQGRTEAIRTRRSVRTFTTDPVDPAALTAALGDALTAPAPHHTHPVRFVWLRDRAQRQQLLDSLAAAWRADLQADGFSAESIAARLQRGRILYDAPEVVIPVMVLDGAHDYPDDRRRAAERTMFTVAAGAAVQGLLVGLATRGLGSCWVGSTIFAAPQTRAALALPDDWNPLGAVAIGHSTELPTTPRPPAPLDDWVLIR